MSSPLFILRNGAGLTIHKHFCHPKTMKKTLLLAALGIFFAVVASAALHLFLPLPIGDRNAEVEIPKGSTFRQVADIFAREGIIRNRMVFLIMGRVSHIDRKIRAGFYSIYGSMNLLDLFDVLRKGQIIEYEVTVVEGDSLREIASKLTQKGIMPEDDFHRLAVDRGILNAFAIDAPSLEGYLYPDTYRIPKGMEAREVIGMMVARLRQQFSDAMRDRAEDIGLSEREVLTLASIIEKEAATDEERPLISAVYHNRLRKKIPLQADPTAVYGIKSAGERITSDDLKRKTPYNTYKIQGLPPGPISSPGLKSIVAALYPANVRYIYFVSNNDGTHHFSTTAEEHAVAVRAYRAKRNAEVARRNSAENSDASGTHDSP